MRYSNRCLACDTHNDPRDTECGVCGTPLSRADTEAAAPRTLPSPSPSPSMSSAAVPAPTGDHVDFSHGTFHAPVIGVQNNYPAPASAPADSWPRLTEVRRLTLGIRPVLRPGGEPDLAPYIRRDVDDELDRLLAHRLRTGGLVVVTGEPLSGTSRTAWAALRRVGGSRARVLNAQPGTDLSELPALLRGRDRSGTHVVWLDDLEGHLGERGMTAGLLAQCVHEGVLVLATMGDEAYDAHRFGDRPTARVLGMARTVELTCRWSEAELDRLAAADDPRLTDAARRRGPLGVTQFLAVGPELWEEWRRSRRPSARPGAYELVRGAVDMGRCGMTAALDVSAWLDLFDVHLPDVEEDVEWAALPRLGVCGLLVRGERPGTWRASEPLVAAALRSPDLPPLGPGAWWFAAEMASIHRPSDLAAVVEAGRADLLARGEEDDWDTVECLADLAVFVDDDADARHWFGRLADGRPDRAWLFADHLVRQGETTAAIGYYERAAQVGHLGSQEVLGRLLLEHAEHWLAIAAAGGSEAAATRLAALREALARNPATVKE